VIEGVAESERERERKPESLYINPYHLNFNLKLNIIRFKEMSQLIITLRKKEKKVSKIINLTFVVF